MAGTGYETIEVSRYDRGLVLAFSREERLNPVSMTMLREIQAVLRSVEGDSEIATVVLTGKGRAFSAGADLRDYVAMHRKPAELDAYLGLFRQVLSTIEQSDRVFIAGVNGVCVAGGLEIMLACDLAYASQSARIGDGHANFAQMAGAGGSQRLPHLIGERRAKELMFSGKLLSAEGARNYGLVNEVIPDDGFLDGVIQRALSFHDKSQRALALMKRMIMLRRNLDFDAALQQEIAWAHEYMSSDPHAAEGLEAFAAKRKPVFR